MTEPEGDPDLAFPDEPARGAARCAVHPERAMVFTCERCGSFGCADCQSLRDETRCATCMRSELDHGSASYLAIAAALLGFFGVLFPPLGWLGAAFGLLEVARSASSGPSPSRNLAGIGLGLAILGTMVWAWAVTRAMDSAYGSLGM